MLNKLFVRNIFYCFILTISSGTFLQAQILDDSTKQLYGYHSIYYWTEADVFLNTGAEKKIDSSLLRLQRYGFVYHNNQFSQDLGNWGTPLKNLTYVMPSQLGRQTGFDAYSPYEFNPDNVKYYNTRSPYAEIKYYQGSRGQQSLDASITRNINPYWNVGFDIRRIVSRKIFGMIAKTDKQSENYSFDCFVSHHSENKKYFLLATFTHFYQKNYETGGIKADSGQTKDDLYNYQLEPVWLLSGSARTIDRRYNYRLYQQYDLIDDHRLQIFYRFDYSRRTNRYDDLNLGTNLPYYQQMLNYTGNGRYDTSIIRDRTDFNLLDNRVGVKGNTASLFYSAFVKNRFVSMTQNTYSDSAATINNRYSEWYGDAQLRKYLNEEQTAYIDGKTEIGFGNVTTGSKGNYMADLLFKNKGLTLNGSVWSVSPSLIQQHYISDMTSWNNNFKLQKTNNVSVQYEFKKEKIDIVPLLNITTHKDYVYYSSLGTPSQYTNTILHIQPSLGLRFNVKKVHIYNQFQYNYLANNSSSYILRMPTVVNSTQIFWESWLFKRATLLQAGFDVLCRNSYYAYGYNPLIQQYYVTSSVANPSSFNYVNGYVVVDFFVNIQVRTARIFLKMSNLTQGIFEKQGYFATPYYTALPRTIDFGISWRFFD